MPLAGNNHLDELYAKHRLLQAEASRLETELAALPAGEVDRQYLLQIESSALREEATRIGASISDILDRDLQR